MAKKQIRKWFLEHRENAYCNNKIWWKKCKSSYICDISKFGYIYIHIHKEKVRNYLNKYVRLTFYEYLLYNKII